MVNLIQSELIKLRSTKALWWTSGLILFFSIGFALLNGGMTGSLLNSDEAKKDPELYMTVASGIGSDMGLSGFLSFGMMIVMIQAVMLVTTEYGANTSKTTLLATPTRWQVPIAKFIVYGVIASILAFVSNVLGTIVARWSLGWNLEDQELLNKAGLGADGLWDQIWRIEVYLLLTIAAAIGVGYLVRNTAGGIAIMLLWNLVIEGTLVQLVPKVRDWLPPYMPFTNADAFTGMRDLEDAPWGQTGSILYFGAWCVVLFVVGVVMLKKRDA
ncbi:ABC transporter permease subunit [uncultured Corynebacterium sp.]|uniref:ABC transporter permease subunit n=1 Tax=uncultured Corynebacterium sp. TaxID=159447 RepID=UPI0025DB98D5|nr:ABC transporter permease subunit [uncultured Corynebacterium sp.]